MVKKAKSGRKAKGAKKSKKKVAARVARKITAGICAPGAPDQRYPVHGDPYHEIVCKCIDGNWLCRQVATGGDWSP